jgi:hypothetical protein
LEKEIDFGNFEPKFQQQIQDAKVAKKTGMILNYPLF